MSDDYLWDRTGEPDPEIERLESLLAPARHRRHLIDLPRRDVPRPLPARSWRRLLVPSFALAATILVLIAGEWAALRRVPDVWRVEPIEGAPTVGSGLVRSAQGLRTEEWLETDSGSSARLRADEVGEVEIGPRSRVRILSTPRGQHRLDLAQGILHAYIWAMPGQFHVETPSATAVDLGCAYSIEVDESGDGLLRVTAGWVGFDFHGRESRVPAGAACETRRNRGPGTPYFEGASAGLVRALALLDGNLAPQPIAVEGVISEARPEDALTLWHLLTRVERPQAERIFDALAVLAPPPSGIRREDVLAGDRAALDAWWDNLGLGDAARFRTWRLRSSPW